MINNFIAWANEKFYSDISWSVDGFSSTSIILLLVNETL